MFPKWIMYLLKFFDICGFYTETSNKASNQTQTSSRIFTVHSLLAFIFSCFVLSFTMKPMIVGHVLPYLVNELLQILNAFLTYWVIIFESYFQRENQRKFWQIYDSMEKHHDGGKKSLLRIYLLKLIEFFGVVTVIQIIFMQYFTHYVGNYFLFRIAYLFSQTTYQYRVFYYLFYLELIKNELQMIKNELKDIAESSVLDSSSMKSLHRRTKRRGSTTRQKLSENSLIRINANLQLVFALTKCINQVFGWSNFTTILYCFHLPLTEGNWAMLELQEKSNFYIKGIQC